MTFEARIAAYSALLDRINTTLATIDRQMETLASKYQELVSLHDSVVTDLEKLVASFPIGDNNKAN